MAPLNSVLASMVRFEPLASTERETWGIGGRCRVACIDLRADGNALSRIDLGKIGSSSRNLAFGFLVSTAAYQTRIIDRLPMRVPCGLAR
jgi:hypothetical protein